MPPRLPFAACVLRLWRSERGRRPWFWCHARFLTALCGLVWLPRAACVRLGVQTSKHGTYAHPWVRATACTAAVVDGPRHPLVLPSVPHTDTVRISAHLVLPCAGRAAPLLYGRRHSVSLCALSLTI